MRKSLVSHLVRQMEKIPILFSFLLEKDDSFPSNCPNDYQIMDWKRLIGNIHFLNLEIRLATMPMLLMFEKISFFFDYNRCIIKYVTL